MRGIAQVIIAKHRNGSLDTVNLRFIGQYIKFAELDEFASTENSNLRPLSDFTGDTTAHITRRSRMDELDDDQDEPPF